MFYTSDKSNTIRLPSRLALSNYSPPPRPALTPLRLGLISNVPTRRPALGPLRLSLISNVPNRRPVLGPLRSKIRCRAGLRVARPGPPEQQNCDSSSLRGAQWRPPRLGPWLSRSATHRPVRRHIPICFFFHKGHGFLSQDAHTHESYHNWTLYGITVYYFLLRQ